MSPEWEVTICVQEGPWKALAEGWEPYAAVYDPMAKTRFTVEVGGGSFPKTTDGAIIHLLRRRVS